MVEATDLSTFVGSQIDFSWNGKLNLGLRNNNYYSNGYAYHSLEPRISYLQPISPKSSIKFSYSRMSQPVQRLTNPGLGLPQDIILSSGKEIKPQLADHLSIEFAKNFQITEEQFSFSFQPFYKNLKNIISFRDGYDTRSLMYGSIYQASGYNEVITSGAGEIFGIEMMLEKSTGKLNGWVNYTVLKATNTFSDLNQGYSFSPAQDRRHSFNVVANWQVTKKWNVGLSWMFISGQPVNVPESVFVPFKPDYGNGGMMIEPSSNFLFDQGTRGNYRMKPFHKLDITAMYKFKLLGLDAIWNVGAYNVYNRMNPSFYYIGKSEGAQPVLKSVSLFPIMPSSSLSIKF
ncbi:MAG: TonB-dependent receptor plug domain-containing protein [Bacteroidia bacterium]